MLIGRLGRHGARSVGVLNEVSGPVIFFLRDGSLIMRGGATNHPGPLCVFEGGVYVIFELFVII